MNWTLNRLLSISVLLWSSFILWAGPVALGNQVCNDLGTWQAVFPQVPIHQQQAFIPHYRNENQTFEQVSSRRGALGGKSPARNRLVQRVIKDADGPAQGGRTLLQSAQPFTNQSSWPLSVSNELLVKLLGVFNGPELVGDQNRIN